MSADHDYEHAMLEIRSRLHDPRGSKAAVLVGAGFSRNAVGCTSKHSPFPLWEQLTEGLVKKLYPNAADQKRVLERAGATSAALRLAQEYESAHHRPRLIDFVRDAIRDDEFQPSRLHCELLELPWSDVFTTNYDRLLEKAYSFLWKRRYDTVTNANDLPLARRPRLIKLHGSLPALEHLVLTEEDYRSYPRTYAPFVATVQAALTENVLCLIGFSGDDPNFLAWSGWLRDELRNAAPQTYLFTGEELKPFQRQLLEERHIVPIPLKRIMGADKWELAYQRLFAILAQRPEKPTPSWNVIPQQAILRDDPCIAEEPFSPDPHDWIDTAILWRSHRQDYKGWCVLHRDATKQLWSQTDSWINYLRDALNERQETVCIFVLHELIWRWSTALRPLYDNIVFKVIDPQLERFVKWRSTTADTTCEILGKEQRVVLSLRELDDACYFIMQECLRHAREIGDDERFQQFLTKLRAHRFDTKPDVLNDRGSFIQYQEALRSLGGLKYAAARHQLETWDTTTSSPIWSIRRAGLCLECDLVSLAEGLLRGTLKRLRSVPVSAAFDIRELSSEGITLYLLGRVNAWHESQHKMQAAISKKKVTSDGAAQDEAYTTQTIDEPTVTPAFKERDSGRTVSSDASSSGSPQEVSQQQILERLLKLTDYGCNPSDYMEWLQLAVAPEPKAAQGYHEHEGFDIGWVTRTVSHSDEPQLNSAYEAMRFIEDAGVPLKMTSPGGTATIAGGLFRDAVRTIGHFCPHEAVGLVLRSRDMKLVEDVFTRNCLARLSASQVNSLADAALQAVREAVKHLEQPMRPIDAKDHFWEEQFKVACETLGRIGVRLPHDRVPPVFCEVSALPCHPNISGSMWRCDILAKCIQRLARALDKQSVLSMLPTLLSQPIQGSEAAAERDWYDPVSIVTDFDARQDTACGVELGSHVDTMMARIAEAKGKERTRLCCRATDLLCANLLSSEQMAAFASSLYAHCDQYGLPADTGCFDSLVLLLPPDASRDEREMFRQKYLLAGTADNKSWRNLRRTAAPLRLPRSQRRRSIRWTKKDVATILLLSSKWLDALKPPHADKAQSASKQFWLSLAGAEESAAARQAALCDWLATLENTVLLNPHASAEQVDLADSLIASAQRGGWCVTQAVPTRVVLGKVAVTEAVAEIRCRLGDRDVPKVRQACDAIVQWCELRRARGFRIPKVVLQLLGSAVAVHRHESLPLLITASMDVIERLDKASQREMRRQIEPGLEALLSETDYAEDQFRAPHTIGMKLRIRVACARLARTAGAIGISSRVLDQWATAIKNDTFADVRRHLSD